MDKIKSTLTQVKNWFDTKYKSGEALDLLIMVGIGICVAGILSVIFF